MYSDLGHAGRSNIRISWIYVKICLLLITPGKPPGLSVNRELNWKAPRLFRPELSAGYSPAGDWDCNAGGDHCLASLNLRWFYAYWRGHPAFSLDAAAHRLSDKFQRSTLCSANQLVVDVRLYFLGVELVLQFQGIKIYGSRLWAFRLPNDDETTTLLLFIFLKSRLFNPIAVYGLTALFTAVETAFLVANLEKFSHGGYVTFLGGFFLFGIMWIWQSGRTLRKKLTVWEKTQ